MLLFLDIETTGFDKEKDTILEVSAVRFDGRKEVARFDRLVRLEPEVCIPDTIVHLTGITNELCEKEGIPWMQLQQELEEFLEPGDIITGHNISFDTGFLKAKGVSLQHKEIDTFLISILVLGRTEESHSLEMLSQKYGLVHENAHRALSDVLANAELYWLLETVWAHNFDAPLDSFLMEYSSKMDFFECFFFDSVRDRIEDLVKTPIPPSLFPQQNTVWETSSSLPDVVSLSGSNPIFWETSFPERNVKSIVASLQERYGRVVFLYPSDREQKYLEIYESLDLPDLPDIQFISSGKTSLSDDVWNDFLHKACFDRFESIVLVKIWNAKRKNEEVFLRFLNEEWPVVRGLSSKSDCSMDLIHSVSFVPFDRFDQVSEQSQIVVMEGDQLEDMLTSIATTKVFTKRFKEDDLHNPQWEGLYNGLQKIAQLLRHSKGDNQYSLPIPLVQAQEIEGFSVLWDEVATKAYGDWRLFFDEKRDDNLFLLIELFPDNELAFSLTPIDVSDLAQPLLERNPIVLGKSFARYNGEVCFSFDLPLETKEFFDPLPDIEQFSLPDVQRTLSATEFADEVKSELESGVNIVVSVNSKKVLDEVVQMVRTAAQNQDYIVFSQGAGSIGKIRTQLLLSQSRGQKIILIATPRYLDLIRVENFSFQTLMVTKPMFDPPKQPFLSQKRALYRSDFEEFSLPRALMRFRREVRRFSSISTLFLGDGRVGNTASWARAFWDEVL